MEISELYEDDTGNITLNQIFEYKPDLGLIRCGNPNRMSKFEMAGFSKNELFKI